MSQEPKKTASDLIVSIFLIVLGIVAVIGGVLANNYLMIVGARGLRMGTQMIIAGVIAAVIGISVLVVRGIKK